MQSPIGDMPELELALMRRSLGDIAGTVEHCHGCQRAMLIGERVYEYESGELRCALCRDREAQRPRRSPARCTPPPSGNSIRMLDRRPVRRAAVQYTAVPVRSAATVPRLPMKVETFGRRDK